MARRYFRFTLSEGEMRHFSLRDGAVGGLIAGWVFAIAQMIAALATREPTNLPWRMAASLVLGREALRMEWSLGLAFVAFAVHFSLSILFGMLWAAAARGWPSVRDSIGSHTALSSLFGVLVWLLNVQLVARGLFPWLMPYSSFTLMLLHALAYGLPLGLYVATRVRAVDHIVEEEGERPA